MDAISGALVFTTAAGFVVAQAVNHAAFKLVSAHYPADPNASAHAAVIYAVVVILLVIIVVAGVRLAAKCYNGAAKKREAPLLAPRPRTIVRL